MRRTQEPAEAGGRRGGVKRRCAEGESLKRRYVPAGGVKRQGAEEERLKRQVMPAGRLKQRCAEEERLKRQIMPAEDEDVQKSKVRAWITADTG